MFDGYRPEDVVAVSLAIVTLGFLPVVVGSLWMAVRASRQARKRTPTPPRLPVEYNLAMREIELRFLQNYYQAPTTIERERYAAAIESLRELACQEKVT